SACECSGSAGRCSALPVIHYRPKLAALKVADVGRRHRAALASDLAEEVQSRGEERGGLEWRLALARAVQIGGFHEVVGRLGGLGARGCVSVDAFGSSGDL